MALLELSGVSLAFAGLHALRNVGFAVEPNQIVGLIGPNGAGKSTLINCISRLYRPDCGSMHFNGHDLTELKSHEVAAIGIRRTFQNLELFRQASVRENVTLGLAYRHRSTLVGELLGFPAERARRRAAEAATAAALAAAGLSAEADLQVGDLPYGLQKTVEMARALVGLPKLLLLDEPAAGMNPEESRAVADRVRGLRDDKGISVLLVEHDMRVIMSTCDHIVVLDHGEKIAEGTPADIRRSPTVIRAYLGDGAADA
jgi:ABC-type branched-subunit amino acid transport system ATPase component